MERVGELLFEGHRLLKMMCSCCDRPSYILEEDEGKVLSCGHPRACREAAFLLYHCGLICLRQAEWLGRAPEKRVGHWDRPRGWRQALMMAASTS